MPWSERVVGFACLASAACTLSRGGPIGPPPIDSSGSLGTDQLTPSFSAVDLGDGNGITVFAALVAQDGDFVELAAGDSLSATVGSQTSPLGNGAGPSADGSVDYTSAFPSSSGASTVTVALDRSKATSAPLSSTIVPAPFNVQTAPPPHVSSPHTYTILLDVTPTVSVVGESWALFVSGVCIQDYVASTADQSLTINVRGQLIFDTSKLILDPDSIGCTLSIFVSHVHDGTYAPPFSGPVPGQSVDHGNPFVSSATFRGVQARAWDTLLLSP